MCTLCSSHQKRNGHPVNRTFVISNSDYMFHQFIHFITNQPHSAILLYILIQIKFHYLFTQLRKNHCKYLTHVDEDSGQRSELTTSRGGSKSPHIDVILYQRYINWKNRYTTSFHTSPRRNCQSGPHRKASCSPLPPYHGQL